MRPSFLLFSNLTLGRFVRAAEIGVRYGDNAIDMLSGKEGLDLLLVDSFKETDAPNAEKRVREKLENFKDRARLMVEDSKVAAGSFEDEYFDYVYIDGGHEYEQVKSDIEHWWPKVKKTGMLAGHDYQMESVKCAVKSFVDDRNHLFVIDDLSNAEMVDWFYIKRS